MAPHHKWLFESTPLFCPLYNLFDFSLMIMMSFLITLVYISLRIFTWSLFGKATIMTWTESYAWCNWSIQPKFLAESNFLSPQSACNASLQTLFLNPHPNPSKVKNSFVPYLLKSFYKIKLSYGIWHWIILETIEVHR